jgi:penicillin-binding protein 1A
MMVHMLKSVVSEGTGSSLRNVYGISNDVAGKTGTTQSNVDGWFMAMLPKLVIGAWVGADDPRMHFRSTALGQGAATALPIVGKFIKRSNEDKTLRRVMWARFEPLPAELLEAMDCKGSKSNQNFFQRLFGKKKGVKVTKFKKKNNIP